MNSQRFWVSCNFILKTKVIFSKNPKIPDILESRIFPKDSKKIFEILEELVSP